MNESDQIYAELLSAVVRLHKFSTIFYFEPEAGKERCQVENWLPWSGNTIPLLLWRSVKSLKLSQFISTDLLVLACLPGVYREDLLKALFLTLRYMRQAKLLIELSTIQDTDLASRVLWFCLQNHMVNAALIFNNFGQTHTFYSYDAYPNYAPKSQQFTTDLASIYPDKMLDLHGFQMRTMPDLSEPNTILYHDNKGNPRLLGYVWNMLEEYARKHNASLHLSSIPQAGKTLSHIQVLDLARDGIVDIAASVQPVTLRYLERYHEYAYPVHMGKWCTMLPMEPLLGAREAYIWMLPALTLCCLAILWIIYELLRGRWQRHRRLLGIGWLILTALLICNVQGRLASLFIAPPPEPHINSFGALSNSKLNIFGLRSEYSSYDFDMRTRYASVFRLTDKMSELISLRNSLNTSYAYTVTHTKWRLYEEQQAHCARPLFYFSDKLCYYLVVPFAMVIPENSPHRVQLDHFMLQIVQSGLYMHWVDRSFYYMVQAGKLPIKELSEPRHIRSLTTQDLQNVLKAYLLSILISLTVFACEVILCRIRAWLIT